MCHTMQQDDSGDVSLSVEDDVSLTDWLTTSAAHAAAATTGQCKSLHVTCPAFLIALHCWDRYAQFHARRSLHVSIHV